MFCREAINKIGIQVSVHSPLDSEIILLQSCTFSQHLGLKTLLQCVTLEKIYEWIWKLILDFLKTGDAESWNDVFVIHVLFCFWLLSVTDIKKKRQLTVEVPHEGDPKGIMIVVFGMSAHQPPATALVHRPVVSNKETEAEWQFAL